MDTIQDTKVEAGKQERKTPEWNLLLLAGAALAGTTNYMEASGFKDTLPEAGRKECAAIKLRLAEVYGPDTTISQANGKILEAYKHLQQTISGPSVESLENTSRKLAARMNDWFEHKVGTRVEFKDLENIIFCVLNADLRGGK
jgi:hypothetical protein